MLFTILKSGNEFEAALTHIDVLLDAIPITVEDDEIELLSRMIEKIRKRTLPDRSTFLRGINLISSGAVRWITTYLAKL
jgi:hypothetical protein